MAHVLVILHGPHRKQRLQQSLAATKKSLRSCYLALAKIEKYIGPLTFLLIKIWTVKEMTRPTVPLLLRVFVAAGTCSPTLCLAPKQGIHLTGPFPPSNDRGIHTRHTH
jgi:hypothetical protein